MGKALITPVAVLAIGCGANLSPESMAVIAVASELHYEVAGFAPARAVAISPEWIGGDALPDQLLNRLRDVTDLPVWDTKQRDGTVAALAFHQPLMADPGAVTVVAELLTFDATGFYGRDWHFQLDRLKDCRVVARSTEPGWLN